MRILIVEDEKRIQDFLSRGLESAGYAVDVAGNGNTAIELVHATEYDLIILDLMLPDMDGLAVLQKIRNRKVNPPVLILSARDAVDDRVKGLELGADDYLTKPFAFVELLARVRALLRRGQPTPERLQVGDLIARLHTPHRDARRREHRAGAKRVQHSRIPDAQPRATAQPDHDRRARLGHGLRRAHQHRRRLHPAPAQQDRRQVAGEDDPHGSRNRIHAGGPRKGRGEAGRASHMTALAKALAFTRGLRFRLAFSYVFFFAVLLIFLGILFRQTLSATFQAQMANTLEDEWGAAKGYLRTGTEGPNWFYDSKDPDETFTVERLRRVYMLADTQGHPLQYSVIYSSIGLDSPSQIKSILASGKETRVLKDAQGIPYLIRSGLMVDERGNRYYLAIGRAVDYNDKVLFDFTRNYFAMVPVVILLSGLLGWFLAGKALRPVNSVSDAAQRITHSNLHVQIPLRHAGDELDRLIEAFNHMMSRLNRSFEQIRQFSTDVSHELRTPLTVARGQLEVAMFTAQTVEQHREAMAEALEGIDRLSNIVRALLLLSQSESGQLALQKSRLDLAELLRDQVDQHQIPAEAQGVRLFADLPAGAMIQADRIQIERLVSNLLGNAIKYTPAGGQVVARLTLEGSHVKLVVEDTGVGIAPDHLPHIFERFYRVPSADADKGLGLGLSFVAWIVQAHGGTVEVESEVQKGTRFVVKLPAFQQADIVAEAPAAPPVTEQVH